MISIGFIHLIMIMKTYLNSILKKQFQLDGQQISWQHIVSIFEWDIGKNRTSVGFKQTRLTSEHVHLSSRSKMNVSMAAQVRYTFD